MSITHYLRTALIALICLIGVGMWTDGRAMSVEDCQQIVVLYETAIKFRVAGHPEHRAYLEVAKVLDHEWQRESWAGIVHAIYDLPHSSLNGAGRADVLDLAFNICLEHE